MYAMNSRPGLVAIPALTQTVHIVDDEESIRTSLFRLLTVAGIAVKTYCSGDEYLATGPAVAAGCVLLDLSMPGCTGLELQEKLRQAGRSLPIIFLTGN